MSSDTSIEASLAEAIAHENPSYVILDEKFQDVHNIVEVTSGKYATVQFIFTVVSFKEFSENDPKINFQYIVCDKQELVTNKENFDIIVFNILLNIIEKEGI